MNPAALDAVDDGHPASRGRPAIIVDFRRASVTTFGQLFAKIFTLETDRATGQKRVVMEAVKEWDECTIPQGEPVRVGYMYASEAGGDDVQRGGKFLACCRDTLQKKPNASAEEWRKRALSAARPLFYPPQEDAADGCCVVL